MKLDEENVDLSFQNFYSKIDSLVEKHAPLQKLTQKHVKTLCKPWITKGIQIAIHKRNKLQKLFLNSKDPILKKNYELEFKRYRNMIVSLSRKSKRNHFSSYFQDNIHNLKKIWQGINSIIANNKSKSSSVSSIYVNENRDISSDPIAISNKFNEYFSNVAEIARSKIPYSSKHFSEFLKNSNDKTFFISPTDETEIISCITSLNNNKSSGPYSIPIKILQLIKNDIAKPLSQIINLSFSTGHFPSNLKTAKVIPIFKKDSPLECSNYRPISLLSNIDKFFEKLMFSRIIKFLETSCCIYPLQFGFRKHHSTNDTLINITENIRSALDKSQFACGVFVDLQKAFDTVDHVILLKKLEHYGIRGIGNSWFHSYLSNRSQFVSILGFNSSLKSIMRGVPQGSVLGPLLFLLYINDLHEAIKYCMVHHFADDTNLLLFDSSLKSLQKKINIDLKLLCHWLNANKISLNTKKTEYILFRHKQKTINFNLKLKLNGKKLYPSSYIKYLGIFLDENLNWKKHVSILSSKLRRANGALAKLRHFVPPKTLISVYHAIFNSHLNYGNQIWCQNQNSITNRIFILQKSAIRIMCKVPYRTHTDPFFYSLGILKLFDQIQCHNALFLHKILNNKTPKSVCETFAIMLHSHNTRNKNLIITPLTNTNFFGTYSIKHQCITIWNHFSNIFANQNLELLPFSSVKKLITNYFLNSYNV